MTYKVLMALMISAMVSGCGSNNSSGNTAVGALAPIAYVDSRGTAYGPEEEVAKLQKMLSQAGSDGAVTQLQRACKVNEDDPVDPGIPELPPSFYCPGGSCSAQGSSGSCAVTCPAGTLEACMNNPLQCMCPPC